jgi:thioredoxin reductase
MFDVLVIGGGPAGLSAALMLGRCRRRVLVCDLGEPRNRQSRALHGFLTRDGVPPRTLNDLGRRELATYGVEFRCVGVTDARRAEGHFRVALASGAEERARYLLIATGVVDSLPGIAGIEDCYGRSVFHCPYCDAWEWRDHRLAALGRGRDASALALSLRTWSHDVALCTDGGKLIREARERLARNGITIRLERITALEHQDGMLTTLAFENGDRVPCDAIFFTAGQHPQSELAIRLGCTLTERGTVRTGTLCETNVPGVYVAGDASRDAQFAVVAASEGVKAALAINKALQKQELA